MLTSRFHSTMNYGALCSWVTVISRSRSTMNDGTMCHSVLLISRFHSSMNYGALCSWVMATCRSRSTANDETMRTSVPLISMFHSSMNYGALYSWVSVVCRFQSAMNYGHVIVDFRSHLSFSHWWNMKLFVRQHATCRFQTYCNYWNAAQLVTMCGLRQHCIQYYAVT